MSNIVVLGTGMAGFGAAHSASAPKASAQWCTTRTPTTAATRLRSVDEQGLHVRPRPAHFLYEGSAHPGSVCRDTWTRSTRRCRSISNNYLARPAPHASGAAAPERPAGRSDRRGHCRLRARTTTAERQPINNYEDWLVASFGRTFAELFPMQYTRKYHLTTADNMSTDWLGPAHLPAQPRRSAARRARPWSPEVHYITTFPLSDATAASSRI